MDNEELDIEEINILNSINNLRKSNKKKKSNFGIKYDKQGFIIGDTNHDRRNIRYSSRN